MTRNHITRIRHETRRRVGKVASVDALTPRMLRIGFTARDLRDFGSACLHYELDAPDMKIYVRRRKDKGHGQNIDCYYSQPDCPRPVLLDREVESGKAQGRDD